MCAIFQYDDCDFMGTNDTVIIWSLSTWDNIFLKNVIKCPDIRNRNVGVFIIVSTHMNGAPINIFYINETIVSHTAGKTNSQLVPVSLMLLLGYICKSPEELHCSCCLQQSHSILDQFATLVISHVRKTGLGKGNDIKNNPVTKYLSNIFEKYVVPCEQRLNIYYDKGN